MSSFIIHSVVWNAMVMDSSTCQRKHYRQGRKTYNQNMFLFWWMEISDLSIMEEGQCNQAVSRWLESPLRNRATLEAYLCCLLSED